jgi:PqqD family protein of HPr-rel-A system
LWRLLDTDWMVFNPNSGDTHLLNEVSAQSLRALERECLTADELVVRIASILGIEPDHLHDSLPRLLAEFEELGLVEAAGS